MKKIMIQLLADSLKLSRVTVWKVLNNRPGVAAETAQRVRNAIEKLQQEDSPEIEKPSFPDQIKNVTLLCSRAYTSTFWMRIVDQIASELHMLNIALNYIPFNVMHMPLQQLISMLHPDKTDGVIIINVYDQELISLLSELNLPKVFLDTTPGHTVDDLRGDLILLEGERSVESITNHLFEKGCRRIGFIGDIHYAQTNLLRWKGFVNAHSKRELPIDNHICLTEPIDKDAYREHISMFLDSISNLPDAFVCASDFVAFTIFNFLNNYRCCIPEDLILTGYDGTKDFMLDHHRITTVQIQKGLLGTRIVNQLIYRINHQKADFEEIYISSKIIFQT